MAGQQTAAGNIAFKTPSQATVADEQHAAPNTFKRYSHQASALLRLREAVNAHIEAELETAGAGERAPNL